MDKREHPKQTRHERSKPFGDPSDPEISELLFASGQTISERIVQLMMMPRMKLDRLAKHYRLDSPGMVVPRWLVNTSDAGVVAIIVQIEHGALAPIILTSKESARHLAKENEAKR